MVASATIISGSIKTLSPSVFSPQAKRRRKIVQKPPSRWLGLDYLWLRPGSPIVLGSPQLRHPPPWTWLKMGAIQDDGSVARRYFLTGIGHLLLLPFFVCISVVFIIFYFYLFISSNLFVIFLLLIYALLCLLILVTLYLGQTTT